jgi:cell division transport system ATP-binding protein
VIEFESAGFGYGQTAILTETDLTIAPGSFRILLGPSGSGKTTFLRLCTMDLLPSTGRIRFFGKSIKPRKRDAVDDLRRAIGVMHQDCRFLDHLPLIDNIALPLQLSGLDARERAGDLEALLDWVDLADRTAALPPTLSESERRRAALARAVILSPEVILADEPTAGTDRDMAERLLTLLVELNGMGKAVLIATHDSDLARAASARVEAEVLVLGDGRILPAGADV